MRATTESADKASLEDVARELVESGDREAVMAGELLQAILNRPEPFVFETRHCASSAFLDSSVGDR